MTRFHVLAFFIWFGTLTAWPQTNLQEMIKKQSLIASELVNPLEGFTRKLSGQDIDYHSTRQDCEKALLVRATDGNMSISWETLVPVETFQQDGAELFLISGMSLQGYDTKGIDPGFQVIIDNRPYFHFKNSMGENWKVPGPDGSWMSFQTIFLDQARDGFGYTRIHLPVTHLKKDKPLHVEIKGDATGSQHWFMVFQCPDALEWFRQKARIDGWFEIILENTGDKWVGEMVSPLLNMGEKVGLPGAGGKMKEVALESRNDVAFARFELPANSTHITFRGPNDVLISNLDLQSDYSKSEIKPDRMVSYQVSRLPNEKVKISVQVSSSTVARDIASISDSELVRGKIHIMASSHQDIAWMDSPQACVEDRDNLLITPALKKLEENPLYYNDMEDILMLREYLARHPEKKDLIANLTREGRLTWGASYIQPYEEMYFGEPLIRQFYLGRKWFRDQFPGCDARIYWNVDVPGRTLQMPQILGKSGVDYMIISRHDQGLFNWLAPDGTKVLTYSPGHYYNDWVQLKKGFFESVRHISKQTDFWEKFYTSTTKNPVMPLLSDADMAVPDSYFDYIDTWNSLKTSNYKLPELVHSTAEKFLDEAVATGVPFPTIQGERPAVWLYIHGPSHYEALRAGRSAGRLLPAAEKWSSIRCLVADDWSTYPQERLNIAWESAIYPDHGWGGKNGEITDQTFLDKYREADQEAKILVSQSTSSIASEIAFEPRGLPLVVFNSLSWERTDPVDTRINLPDRTFKGIKLSDYQGNEIPVQIIGPIEQYPSGFLKSLQIVFLAAQVPSVGYQTYYLSSGKNKGTAACETIPPKVLETDFFSVELDSLGVKSLYDKELQTEILNTDQFSGGELFSMRSVGNGAGEFGDIQQPDMEGFERAVMGKGWTIVESGPVRTVIEGFSNMMHNKAKLTWVLYPSLKRIDVSVELLDWNGTAYREFRLGFPAKLQNPSITYEVPFGVVRVGKDELAQPAGERYTTDCRDIHPRGINNWISASDSKIGLTISSSVAVWDYINMTNLPTRATILQPILLASRQSCHGEGPLYHQKGSHRMEFSLFSHQPGWQNGYRQALQANEKLEVVFNPPPVSKKLPHSSSFITLNQEHAIISTIKKSEDGNDLVVRIYDQEGRDKDIKLNFFRGIKAIEKTNLIEDDPIQLIDAEKTLNLKVGHHAIETFRFRF